MKKKDERKIFKLLFFLIFLTLIILIFMIIYNNINIKKDNINKQEQISSKIKIPNGFYYVGGDIETGVVISDNKNDEFKGTEHEKINKLKGNQFVWVPVDNAVVDNIEGAKSLVKEGKNDY